MIMCNKIKNDVKIRRLKSFESKFFDPKSQKKKKIQNEKKM